MRRIGYRLEYAGLRLAEALVRSMTVDRASSLGGFVWRTVAPHTRRHERALAHVALAYPDMPDEERQRIVAGVWDNLGRVFAETFHLRTIAKEPWRLDLSGAGAVARLAETGRGAVLVSLHAGNWELATMGAMRLGLEPGGVYQEVRNPFVEAHLRAMREPFYPAGLLRRRAGEDAAMKVLRLVRGGGTVALLADLRDARGVQVPFFGHPAWATHFPALVARGLGVPLVAAAILRTGGVHFRAEAVEVPVPRTKDRQADVMAATAAVHAVFEGWIREHPEQWFWTHRKWAPPGDRTRII